jgi:hypothetical protein
VLPAARFIGVHPQDLRQLVGIPTQIQSKKGLNPGVNVGPRLRLGLRFRLRLGFWFRLGLWFGLRFRLWFWLGLGFRLRFGLWRRELFDRHPKGGVELYIRLLGCAQAEAAHRIGGTVTGDSLHGIGTQGGVHGKIPAPRLPRLLLNGDQRCAAGPGDLNLLTSQTLPLLVDDVEEDVMPALRLFGIVPENFYQLVGITSQVQGEVGLDARVNIGPWLRLRFRLRLGFRLWFGFRFWLRLGFRTLAQQLPHAVQVTVSRTGQQTQLVQEITFPLGPEGSRAVAWLTGIAVDGER